MTRLANIEKAGFFPLPPVVTDLIVTHLTAPHRGRVLDPCTGEGAALLALADKLDLEPFGIELHEGRAKKAQELVQQGLARRLQASRSAVLPHLPTRRILHDSYTGLITSRGGYNLLYLNPPYDHDDEDGRLEYQWLKLCRPHLQPGGILIWVVPQHLLKFAPAARYIAGWYEKVQVFRFPDPEYAQFRQVVLFGVLRPRPIPPDSELVERLSLLASGLFPLPVLAPASEPVYTLPPLKVTDKQFIFRSWMVDPDEALVEVREQGARTTTAWREHLDAAANHVPLRPLTPLKIGHMSSVIAAGHLNNQVLTASPDPDSSDDTDPGRSGTQTRLLIKGRNYKTIRQSSFSEPLPDGKTRVTYLDTEQVVTDITSVNAQGEIIRYKGPELETFLQQWITPLTDLVAQAYPPVYQFNLNGYGPILNSLSRGRVIPGLNGQTGLLPAQKHAAAAALTRLEKARDCIVVGEMGVGKAQPLDAKVLTPSGWKCMGDIQEGDEVVNPDGGTAFVVGVYPQGRKDIYRVTFSDGSQTECCDEHLWQVITPLRKWRNYSSQVLALQDIQHNLFSKSGNARYFIPIIQPVAFESQELPVDPYLLGALIGDGTLGSHRVLISSMDDEIITEVSNALPEGIVVRHQSATTFRIARGRNSDNRKFILPQNILLNAIRELGLSGKRAESKFIPKTYLFADVPARIALLQGLLDTDGTIAPRAGKISFCTVSEQLAKDVVALIQSLGGVARTRTRYTKYTHNGEKRVGRLSYQIGVSLPNSIQPFRLSRKQQYVIPRTKYGITRALVKVEYIGQKEAQCIALDSENRLYVTDDYIVTHNTTVGIGIAAGMNARRTIILCPPHLVDKWGREARIVWPGVRAIALETISDVDAFFGDQPDSAPLIGVVKQTTARSASGWEHAYDLIGPASHSYGSKGFAEVRRPWGDVSSPIKLLDLAAEERQWRGRVLSERQIMALQGRGVRCPVCGEQQMNRDVPLSVREFKSATRRCDNPKCRSPLYQFSRNRSASQRRGSFLLYSEREALIRQHTDQGEEVPYAIRERWTGSAVRDTFGYGKVPLSAYIKHRAKGRLDLVLVDEAHQYKGIDSDQGYAMHHLAQAARKVVALTGTVYGGKASSLFHLLFRLSPEMNQVYVDRDEIGQRRVKSKEWITSYGILQTIETVTLDEAGKQTANSRSNARMKELPGGSPAMLPWLLNRSVFLSLGDMGFPLPEYTEIPISIPMAPEQEELYESLKAQLKDELKERLVKGDKSLLAGYLYALLFWPDSPRRGKVVTCPRDGKVVASIPRLPDTFVGPKERAIIELCQQEKAQGRRVLLLCGQTDTLDIQPEWKQMLAEAGLKAAILRAEPSKREKWVEQQVQAGVDVLITHPRKVETGLDLLDFPTIVWMAVDYSVYTVLQASRRSWRIGQTEPVKVYFYAYESTLQEDALRLVAAKVAAALRVNGDTIADDSLAELDELSGGDIVTTLARIVTGEVQVSAQSLQQAFAEANVGLRQANQMIGGYEIVEAEVVETQVEPRPSPHSTGNGNGHAVRPLFTNGNGHHQQPSLFATTTVPTNSAAADGAISNGLTSSSMPTNGIVTQSAPINGHDPVNGRDALSPLANGHSHDPAVPPDEPPGSAPAPKPVVIPRPQLLTRLLAGR